MVHIVLDFEMNPIPRAQRRRYELDPMRAELIEIGAVRMEDGSFQVTDEFSIMVCPEYNQRIEPYITRLTGIELEDVSGAPHFAEALKAFFDWIGNEPARIYSWSRTDLAQLKNECTAKQVAFPDNMADWCDFQKLYPEATGIKFGRDISLQYAADLAGVLYDPSEAHRALYDAQVTAQLVRTVLTGEHQELMQRIGETLKTDIETSTISLGDSMGAKLLQLKEQLERSGQKN